MWDYGQAPQRCPCCCYLEHDKTAKAAAVIEAMERTAKTRPSLATGASAETQEPESCVTPAVVTGCTLSDFRLRSQRKNDWEADCRGEDKAQQMAKFLSQDQIHEFKECFSLYDKKHKGKIKASDLMTVMRSLGASPIPGEVARHLQQHKIDSRGELDFSTFLSIMYKQMQQEDPKKEILVAFLMTDMQKTGFITVAELRAKLMNLGERLSREEVDNLLKDTKVGHNGIVKYEDLVRSITLPVVDY
nr:calmodulin-like protein 4 isoform X2 [Anolis sagrei ordinatus]